MLWRIGPDKSIDLARPLVLAILNVTPDSFSDGGQLDNLDAVAHACERARAHGAGGVDIGGESTRPGATRISAGEQITRVVPAIRTARRILGDQPVISIDTTLSAVATAAFDAGADVVNDVSGGTEDGAMLSLCEQRRCGVILMHRLRAPGEDRFSDQYTPSDRPRYIDVVREVGEHLALRVRAALDAGVARQAIVIDPGLGFGKSVEQNLELIDRSREVITIASAGGSSLPLLSGLSRKSFVGRFMKLPEGGTPKQRVRGSVELSLKHRASGASIFRVHDVREHAKALGLIAGHTA
jgi:dihydropteroate synthase